MFVKKINTLFATLLVAGVAILDVPRVLAASFLYVTSDRTDSVLKYDENGNFLGVLDAGSSQPSNGAIGLGLDASGDLYLSRGYLNAILRYDPGTDSFNPATDGTGLASPHQFAFSSLDGSLYVANFANDNIQHFDSSGNNLGTVATTQNPTGVTVDSVGNVYFSSRALGDVFKIDAATSAISVFASQVWPESVTIGKDGYVYVSQHDVSSSGNGKLLRYQTDGTPYGVGGNTTDPTFAVVASENFPTSITFDSQGNVYVAGYDTNNIYRYNSAGQFVGIFNQPGYNIAGAYGLAYYEEPPQSVPEASAVLGILAVGVAFVAVKRKAVNC
jgi:streptogramin lyase